MLFYEAGLLSFTPSERLKRLGSSNVEMQLTSLLLVHQDTGLDAPLKEAQDLCCQMANRIGPGSDAACSSEQILYADIQHAAFLRNEDLASLNEAISCYEGITVLDPILSRRLALGHGRALATLYAHVTGIEHAEKAAQLLSSVLVDNSHDEVAAHALCYLVPLIDQIKWDGEGHSDMADNDYESQLNNVLNTPRRIYLRIMLLLTRCHVAARLSFSKSHHIAADEWYQFSRAALDACPPDHFLLARAYSSLANMYDWRHHLVGDVQDLNLAIDLVAKGLQIHSLTPSMRCTLTKIKIRSLGAQSQATGDLNLLEHAIGLNRMILDLCPPRHRSYPLYVNELMFLLGTHFEITGRIGFIDEIISFAELDIVVKNQWIACNVAEAMRYRAQLASSGTGFVLLQRAIYILKARHEHSSNVSTREKAYISRELGAVYDLQAGIGIYIDQRARLQLARDTVTLGRDAHGGHMENIISLATVLLNQGLRIASAPLIDEAEELIRDALKDQRLPYRLQPTLIALQAELSIIRISMGNISGNILDAWGIFEAVVTDTGGRPRDRLQIAIRWAALAESIDAKSALLAYQRAVEILPQVGYIGEDIMGRVQALRQARDLAPRAASLALRIGEVKQAVELIEHSRGVLWQQSLHLRPPLHLLPPHLSSQLADVSKDLDSSQTSSAERRQSAEKFQSIVLEIRCEPEHEEFLLPRTYSQLVERLPDGFVVWLIPSKTHCDAIIVDSRTRPQATHFRQDGLNQEWLQAIATAFTTVHASALRSIDRKTRPAPLLKEDSASPNHELLLEDLWSNLVQKVIRTLGVAPVSKFDFWGMLGYLKSH
jgi:tetratricopeptide (TPR) repeat protein